MLKVRIKLLDHSIEYPKYATTHSAGMDLCAAIEDEIILKPGKRELIPTGIAIALPDSYEAQVRSRSGHAYKNGIVVLNSPGTIDSDYRGEIKVILCNLGDEPFKIEKGMRIAQLIITQYTKISWDLCEFLDDTQRMDGGFGSTGS